ncbi:hypothetical protein LG296_21285 (plasmid) [Ureibacillus chungkukjangi]|uniref:hypothetical protein n=1 Tax=Ureibacillus chungkukjangi TaxID=1202712 RepID=UPI00384F3B83
MTYRKNQWGFYDDDVVKVSGLPFYDLTEGEEETGITMDLFTKTDLKNLGFLLSKEEQETMIRGFLIISKRQKGWAALYNLQEIMLLKLGWTYKKS